MNHIRMIRKEQKLSLKALSERCGVSEAHLRRIEHGESDPTLKTLCRIAWGLRKDVWEVFECKNCK